MANRNLNESSGIEAYEIPPARKNRGMTQLTVTLIAGVPQRFELNGDYFHVITAPVNDLMVRFDDSKQAAIYSGVGKRVYYEGFELSSATGQTVVIEYGFGSVFDGRASANVNVTANVKPGNTLSNGGDVPCAAGAATLLLAADPTRIYATVANASTNSNTMRIGSSAVTNTSGMLLEPGMSLPIATTAALYAWNTNNGGTGSETLTVGAVREV